MELFELVHPHDEQEKKKESLGRDWLADSAERT